MACIYEPEAELYYMEIKSAHPDNERFIEDFEKLTGRKVNKISGKYEDQFDVIHRTRYVNGTGGMRRLKHFRKRMRN